MATTTPESERKGRRRRGLILAGIAGVLLLGYFGGSYPADRHARDVELRLRAAAASVGYTSLSLPAAFEAGQRADTALEKKVGLHVWVFAGPVAAPVAARGERVVELRADSHQWWTFWQPRCVMVRLHPDLVESRVVNTPDCFKARWPEHHGIRDL